MSEGQPRDPDATPLPPDPDPSESNEPDLDALLESMQNPVEDKLDIDEQEMQAGIHPPAAQPTVEHPPMSEQPSDDQLREAEYANFAPPPAGQAPTTSTQPSPPPAAKPLFPNLPPQPPTPQQVKDDDAAYDRLERFKQNRVDPNMPQVGGPSDPSVDPRMQQPTGPRDPSVDPRMNQNQQAPPDLGHIFASHDIPPNANIQQGAGGDQQQQEQLEVLKDMQRNLQYIYNLLQQMTINQLG